VLVGTTVWPVTVTADMAVKKEISKEVNSF